MMIRKFVVALALPVLFFLFPQAALAHASVAANPSSLAQQGKDYSADRFDSAIAVQNDGTLLVTETVVFNFSGGPFTFVYREIPTDKTDGITILAASVDQRTMSQGTGAGQFEVTGDNPIKVTWHFAPTSDQTHTFTLAYRVLGVVQKEQNADVLYWNALPTDYAYSIRSSTVTVTYPANVHVVGTPQVRDGDARVTTSTRGVIFSANNLFAKTPLEIGLRFPAGSLIAQVPHWQQVQKNVDALLLPDLAGGIAIFLIGTFGLILYYRSHRRSTPIASAAALQFDAPPDNLPPAMAGTLTSGSTSWNQALATFFNLAQRGVLVISESSEKRRYQKQPDYLIELLREPEDLLPHERGLLNLVLEKASSVKISSFNTTYNGHSRLFTEPLKQEMIERGLYDAERQRILNRLKIIGILLLLLSLIGTGITWLSSQESWPNIFLPLGITAISLSAFMLAAMYSPLSDRGAEEAARWQAFSNFLKDVTSGKQSLLSPNMFDNYLPYATTFGNLANWIRVFQGQNMVMLPSWFRALATSPNGGQSSYYHMMLYTSTMHQSSSSGGAAGGGGGAAGGGSSGAG